MSDPVSPAPERAAGEAGTPTPMCECGHPAYTHLYAHHCYTETHPGSCEKCPCELFRPVAAPRAGGAAEPVITEERIRAAFAHRTLAPEELSAVQELMAVAQAASPVGATSAPASEPTTAADGVRYFAEACVEAAGKLGNDNGLDTKLNATAALLGEYAARLASQASALAAAEQELREIDIVLGNRAAFDPFKTRVAKIQHAIDTLRAINAPAVARAHRATLAPPAGGTGGVTA